MDRLIALFCLKCRMTLRSPSARGSFGIALTAAKVVVFVPAALLLAIGVHALLAGADPHLRAQMTHRLFLFVYAGWLLSPLLGMGGGALGDPTRLAIYPVPRHVLYLASLGGTLTHGAILFALPTLIAAAIATPGSTIAISARVFMTLIFVVHGALMIQVVSTCFARVMRSRRFHDLSAVLVSVVCVGLYLIVRGAFTPLAGATGFGEALLGGPLSLVARLLPSYWVSRPWADLGSQGSLVTLDLSVAFLAVTAGAGALAYGLHGKVLRGDLGGTSPRVRVPSRRLTSRLSMFAGLTRRSPALAAFVGKELRLLSREPLVKAQLIVQTGFLLIPMLLGLSMAAQGENGPPPYMPALLLTGLSFSIVVVESSLLFNMFGLEGRGFAHLLATPMSRKRILLAKNVFYFGLFATANAAVLTGFAVAMHFAYGTPVSELAAHLGRFLVLNWTLLALAISLGNVTSILFPVRLTSMGCNAMGASGSGSESLSRLLMRGIATAAILVVMAPLALLVALPQTELLGAWFYALAIPIAVLVVGSAYGVSIALGERLLERREPQLLQYFCNTTG